MKRIWIIILLFIAQISLSVFAEDSAQNIQEQKKTPSLGTCGDDTDYLIYNCIPFKCKLPIGNYQATYREMEVLGYEGELCLHKFKIIIRNPRGPVADFPMNCKLSKQGRTDMANMFFRYKNGDINAYAGTEPNITIGKECIMQNY